MKKSVEAEACISEGKVGDIYGATTFYAAPFHSDITHRYHTATLCGVEGSNNFRGIEEHRIQTCIGRVPVVVVANLL